MVPGWCVAVGAGRSCSKILGRPVTGSQAPGQVAELLRSPAFTCEAGCLPSCCCHCQTSSSRSSSIFISDGSAAAWALTLPLYVSCSGSLSVKWLMNCKQTLQRYRGALDLLCLQRSQEASGRQIREADKARLAPLGGGVGRECLSLLVPSLWGDRGGAPQTAWALVLLARCSGSSESPCPTSSPKPPAQLSPNLVRD